MNTTSYPRTFPTPGPVSLTVRNGAGRVHIAADDVTETTVSLQPTRPGDDKAHEVIERARLDQRGDEVHVDLSRRTFGPSLGREPGVDVSVTVPLKSVIDVQTGSATVNGLGGLGDVTVKTGSGDVNLESCAEAAVRTGSGDIRVDNATGAQVRSSSGDILIERCPLRIDADTSSGNLRIDHVSYQSDARTASGDVEVGTVEAPLDVTTASGNIRVRRTVRGDLSARAASGDVTVAVVSGTMARLDCSSTSGRVRSDLDPADAPADTDRTATITARSVSGSVSITRAD